MENKWKPCWCTVVLGILAVVFAWWKVSFAAIALTIIGVLVLLQGIANKCICEFFCKKKEGGTSCCS